MNSSNKSSKAIGKSILVISLINAGLAGAQTLNISDLSKVKEAAPGQTINLSLQQGAKSNLSFGTNTSFGANLSTQNSSGMTVSAKSSFTPLQTSISSSIGATEGSVGKTTATIGNLRAQEYAAASGINAGTLLITDPTTNKQEPLILKNSASGEAILDGVGATVEIQLNPESSGFSIESMPNIVGAVGCNAATGSTTPCIYTTADGKKPYDELQVSSGNAGASITSNTNVDIGTTNFISAFSQTY